jgi:hypothetical protein
VKRRSWPILSTIGASPPFYVLGYILPPHEQIFGKIRP